MAQTTSPQTKLGTAAPDFALPNVDGTTVQRSDFAGKPLLVGFICNHCPFVKNMAESLGRSARQFADQGVATVLINSNDPVSHASDAPEHMPAFARDYGINAPYLFDESQAVAKAYGAVCTPDFFLFDQKHTLVYRGRYDASRPGNDVAPTGDELESAVASLLSNDGPIDPQMSSVGCGIKWRPGNEPAAFSPLS